MHHLRPDAAVFARPRPADRLSARDGDYYRLCAGEAEPDRGGRLAAISYRRSTRPEGDTREAPQGVAGRWAVEEAEADGYRGCAARCKGSPPINGMNGTLSDGQALRT
jgi:hypothetical protein